MTVEMLDSDSKVLSATDASGIGFFIVRRNGVVVGTIDETLNGRGFRVCGMSGVCRHGYKSVDRALRCFA